MHYVGHSQGATEFFIMAAERPEYNDKIISMNAFAPIAFLNHIPSKLAQSASRIINILNV